jgi:hypothetical protein
VAGPGIGNLRTLGMGSKTPVSIVIVRFNSMPYLL